MLFTIFLVTFLVIFVMTAAISLASLPGWIEVPEPFKKRLFQALILEVVGCVILFVSLGIHDFYNRHDLMGTSDEQIRAFLIKETWAWHYAPKNWYTEGNFAIGPNGQLTFTATTYLRQEHDDGKGDPLFEWKSKGLIKIFPDGISFDCEEKILPKFSGKEKPETTIAQFKLNPTIDLTGNYFLPHDQGGIYLTKDTH
jgi:hypothetical protein